jgi:hypothetical protein
MDPDPAKNEGSVSNEYGSETLRVTTVLSVSYPDPYWIRTQLGQQIRILIGNPDPDPGRAKLAPKKEI